MTEEAYCFVQDNKARKQMAYGARKKIRKGGRYVRMPNDNLTAKQKKELNGKVTTYAMDKPYTYVELLKFPEDIRKEYLQGVIDKYHPSIVDLASMLRVKREKAVSMIKSLGLEMPRYYRNPSEKFEWRVFRGENITPPEPEPVKEVPVPKPYEPESFTFSAGIGDIDHLSLHVVGKPLQVANGIPLLLDACKKYYFSINITEVKDKEDEEDEVCVCPAAETA